MLQVEDHNKSQIIYHKEGYYHKRGYYHERGYYQEEDYYHERGYYHDRFTKDSNQIEIMNLLLKYNPDINRKDTKGFTALMKGNKF